MNPDTRFSIAALASGSSDPAKVAVIDNGAACSYGELDRRADAVAASLVATGLRPGDRIAFVGKNSVECIEVLIGAARAGIVPLALNWRLAPTEMAYVVADSTAALLFVADEFAASVRAACNALPEPAAVVVIGTDGDYATWREAGRPLLQPYVAAAGETALQLYTSGTTGRPKGAMLTHAGFAAAIPDAADFWGVEESSVVQSVLPMFHIAGIGTAFATLGRGATVVIDHDARAEATLSSVATLGMTHLILASVMLQGLVASPAFTGADLSTLECVAYGAAPITVDVLRSVIRKLDCRIVQAYGLTETTGVLRVLDAADHRVLDTADDAFATRRLRSCGRARPGVELRIVDTDSGADVAPGGMGELLARSERIMSGYWNLPADTAEALSADGWFHTGDIATIDADGYLTLHDRFKDMIISGGENVYPIEVGERGPEPSRSG